MWGFIGVIFASSFLVMMYTGVDLIRESRRGTYGVRYPKGKDVLCVPQKVLNCGMCPGGFVPDGIDCI